MFVFMRLPMPDWQAEALGSQPVCLSFYTSIGLYVVENI